jgi:hypothetical protein
MKERTMRRRWIFLAPLAIAGVALFVFIGGQAVKLLWNVLLPAMFAFPRISFWQALGLLVLCRILFGGFGGRGRGHNGWTSRMTPEERDRFRQRIRERWGFRAPSTPAPGGPATM